MKNIVISISDNNELRRNHIVNEFKKSNVDFEFFDAITPDKVTVTEKEIGVDLSNSPLTPGDKGCLLSHLKVLKMAIENKEKYISVFEDDIYLSPSASIYLLNPNWIPPNIDLVKIEKYNKYFPQFGCKKIKTLDGRVLYELKKRNLGAAGYIISIDTAKKILDRLSKKQTILAIDVELFTPELNNNINCVMIEPSICIQDFTYNNSKKTVFPSSLRPDLRPDGTREKTKKTLLMKLKKEISRLSIPHIIRQHILSKKSTYR